MASETFDLLAAYEPGTLSSNTQARPLALHGGAGHYDGAGRDDRGAGRAALGGGHDDLGGGRAALGGGHDDLGGGRAALGGGYDDLGGGRADLGGGYDDLGGGRADLGGGYDDLGGGYDDLGGGHYGGGGYDDLGGGHYGGGGFYGGESEGSEGAGRDEADTYYEDYAQGLREYLSARKAAFTGGSREADPSAFIMGVEWLASSEAAAAPLPVPAEDGASAEAGPPEARPPPGGKQETCGCQAAPGGGGGPQLSLQSFYNQPAGPGARPAQLVRRTGKGEPSKPSLLDFYYAE